MKMQGTIHVYINTEWTYGIESLAEAINKNDLNGVMKELTFSAYEFSDESKYLMLDKVDVEFTIPCRDELMTKISERILRGFNEEVEGLQEKKQSIDSMIKTLLAKGE